MAPHPPFVPCSPQRATYPYKTALTLCNLPLLRDDGTLRNGNAVITVPQAMVRSEGPWPQCGGPGTVAFVFSHNNLVVFQKKGAQLRVGLGDGRMVSVLELEAVFRSGVLFPDGDQEDPDKDARDVARALRRAALSAVGVERTQSFLGQGAPLELTPQAVVTWAKASFKDEKRLAAMEDATANTPGWRLLTHVERLEIGIRVGLQRARSTWEFRGGHQGVSGKEFMKRRAAGETDSLEKMVQKSRQKEEPVFEPLHRMDGQLTATVTSWAVGARDAGWGWITKPPKV